MGAVQIRATCTLLPEFCLSIGEKKEGTIRWIAFTFFFFLLSFFSLFPPRTIAAEHKYLGMLMRTYLVYA